MELRQARDVLVCARWGIGDLVMELPLLRALRQHLPQARITALGANPALQLLQGEGIVDGSMAVQQFGFHHWGDAGTTTARSDIVAWCRRADFDYLLDTTHAPRGVQMALAELALPGRDTGGFDSAATGVPRLDGSARLAAAAAATWGIAVDAAAGPALRLHTHERRAAVTRRACLAAPSVPLVGVAPVASSPLKRGAVDQFARVADALVASADTQVAVFAGDQPLLADALVAAMEHRHRAHVIAPVHLRGTAALLAQCRVLICNDTGLMHLAAAVGTPVVAVFACTSPRLYLPRGGTAVARWAQPCSHVVHDDFGIPAIGGCRSCGPVRRLPPLCGTCSNGRCGNGVARRLHPLLHALTPGGRQ